MFSATPSSCTACHHHTRTEWRVAYACRAVSCLLRGARDPPAVHDNWRWDDDVVWGRGGAHTARGLHTRVVAVRRGAAVLRGATSGERTARSDDVIDNLSEMATNRREHARVCVSAGERR